MFITKEEKCILTPTYHVFDMFKEHQGATSVKSLCDCETLSASASKKDGCLFTTLVNLSAENDLEIDLRLLGGESTAQEVTLLTCDTIFDENTFDNPNKVHPIKEIPHDKKIVLPKASIASVKFKLK